MTHTAERVTEPERILPPHVDSLLERLTDVAATLAASDGRRFLDASHDVALATTAEWRADEDHIGPATGEPVFKALRAALFDLRHLDSAETEDDALAAEIVAVARALTLDPFRLRRHLGAAVREGGARVACRRRGRRPRIAEKAVDEYRTAWKTSVG